jgi:hypothetical protein
MGSEKFRLIVATGVVRGVSTKAKVPVGETVSIITFNI